MGNIFEIEKSLLAVIDEIEENDGIVDEELNKKLEIADNDFKEKVKAYCNVIATKKSEIDLCKQEQKRLAALIETKANLIDRLSKVVIDAVNMFGDISKAGAKFVDYGVGKVSIRKTKAVEVNDDLVKRVAAEIANNIDYMKYTNSFDHIDCLNYEDIIADVARNKIEDETSETYKAPLACSDDDLNNMDMTVSITVPVNDIFNHEGYSKIISALRDSKNYKVSTSVSKTELKPILEENGAATPNLAKLKNNESLIIK